MLRNKKFRLFLILFGLLAAISIALGFALSAEAGVLCCASSAAFGIAFVVFTAARYQNIAKLSHQIDLVLHDENRLSIDGLDEGELSILHSEITKLMLRIREQNDALKQDKVHLADSLADIAHQLRTPLTSANLILSFLENGLDEDKRKAFVRETEGLLMRMDWLITSLLKLSRLDAGVITFQTEPIPADDLVQTALRPLLIPMELHNISLQINAPQGIHFLCDPGWLSEALQNILKNCMESAGDNGSIQIACTQNPLFTEIRITDNGPGFREEELPCLFDRFYRGNSANATGYGIGLALSKTIITRQGGTVTAKNHPQGGAVFAIRFPK